MTAPAPTELLCARCNKRPRHLKSDLCEDCLFDDLENVHRSPRQAASVERAESASEMRKTAAELRATANGNCGAISQAIMWERKAEAVERAEVAGEADRQSVVIEWGERCFGVEHMQDKIVRAARFFEEAAEMVQAVGLPRDHAKRAFDHVYSRPAGDPAQEAGGSANTLMALCGAIGLSLDECQRAEIERCLAKDPSHFAARNEAKLREVDASPPRSEGVRASGTTTNK